MNDIDVVTRFRDVIGSGNVLTRRHTNPRWNDTFVWRSGKRATVEHVVQTFLPYLGDRRRQAAAPLLANPSTQPPPLTPRKSHCKRGHPFDGPAANVRVVVVNGKLHRECRPCRQARKLEKAA